MKVPGWNCADGTEKEDHDWEIVSDWYGDPGVINGTCSFNFMRCRQCGKEKDCDGTELDYYEDWD